MAYLYARKNGRREIREAHTTPRGPRSRTLASFTGALLPEHLDRAEAAAKRPFDRAKLQARARVLGIPVRHSGAEAEARALAARLRGAQLDPIMVSVLRDALATVSSEPVPDALADVIEWLGASADERGRALRDVLRLYDTIARSREPVREPEAPRFPRFEVRPVRRAS